MVGSDLRAVAMTDTSGIMTSAAEASGGGKNSQVEPVKLPSKPTAVQQANISQMTGGPDNPGLRDRSGPKSQISPSSMKKLPAPPPGQVSRFNESGVIDMDSPSRDLGGKSGMASKSLVSNGSRGSMKSRGKVKHENKAVAKALF